jgi:CubicO group peptidase (beta-lactamase class C family)
MKLMCAAALLCFWLAGTVFAGSLSAAKPEDVGMSSERLKRIGENMQRHIAAGDIAGVVTLVARRGRIVHFEAYGMQDRESKKPMPKDGIFRLASMSKPITGTAVMMLVEEGKVRLTDPVSRFIPEFKEINKVAVPRPGAAGGGRGGAAQAFDVVTANREITIRDMLTHTSGLVSGGLGAAVAPQRTENDTLATYIPKMAAVPLDFQPGTLWRYSGLVGFDVLSRVVEIVSGQSYDQFLRQRIFEPLGMKDSGFTLTSEQNSRVATMYRTTPTGLERGNQASSTKYFSGASAIMTTAEDYLQFAQMLLNGGQLAGKRILGPRTVELMTSNHTGDMVNGQFGRPARGMGFGLSMQVVLDPVAADLRVSKGSFSWPGGSGVGFWVEPQEQLVSIYMIQGGSGAARLSFENAIRQAIIE